MMARSTVAIATAMSVVACNAAPAESPPIEVTILRDGRLSIDGQVVTAAEVRRRAPEAGVLLRGEPDIQYNQVTEAMNALQGLDIPIALVGEEAVQ